MREQNSQSCVCVFFCMLDQLKDKPNTNWCNVSLGDVKLTSVGGQGWYGVKLGTLSLRASSHSEEGTQVLTPRSECNGRDE